VAASQIVALCAIRRPFQRLVCFRKRSWGKLCTNGKPGGPYQYEQNGDEKKPRRAKERRIPDWLSFGQHRVSGSGPGLFSWIASSIERLRFLNTTTRSSNSLTDSAAFPCIIAPEMLGLLIDYSNCTLPKNGAGMAAAIGSHKRQFLKHA